MNKTTLFKLNEIFRSVTAVPDWLWERLPVTDQIRLIRETLGMTQDQLAERIGVGQSAVAQIENKKAADIQLSTLEKIAIALNCELLVRFVPKEEMKDLLDKKRGELALKLLSISTGSTALEMQKPQQKYIEKEIEEKKEDILKKHRSQLWRKS